MTIIKLTQKTHHSEGTQFAAIVKLPTANTNASTATSLAAFFCVAF